MIKQVANILLALGLLIVANFGAGMVNSMAINKESFDKARLIQGIFKAIITVIGIFALSYAFDVVDLSSLGFTPATICTTGIVVYGAKLGINIIKILGLSNYVKVTDPEQQTSDKEDNTPVG